MGRKNRKEEKAKKKSKKVIIIVVAIVVILAIIGGIVFFKFGSNNSESENNIATQSVKIFTESMNLFQNRYSGLVVAQDVVKIKKTEGEKIKELYVEKGQSVKKGDKLFEYDTTENSNKVEQAKLEIEKMQNTITNSQKQIQNFAEQRNINPGDQSLTIEIQSLENEIKQTEYNIKTKRLEIDTLNKSIKNAVVKAEIDGIIQNINDGENDTSTGYFEEQDDSYITIMQTGDFKIKGTVSEQNAMMFAEGQKVIIRSRIDENATWGGTISKIDTSNPETDENARYMYNGSDSMSTASKYPFYITLDSKDGLMMGQHVYIEFDYGQENKKDGVWIPSYFIFEEGESNYIWVAGKGDKLEKRKVTIGNKDENLLEVQITEGLSKDDYITEPTEGLTEGLKVNKYDNPEDVPYEEPSMDENNNMETLNEGEVVSEDLSTDMSGAPADTVSPDGGQ